MIPKIIHYCWLSNDPVPTELLNYVATWKKNLPDYEFIKWDFNRFDINSSVWVKEAFENKKYAYAADYIRMYAIYNMGGIYLDMDVEVIKSYDDLLHLDYFICYENSATKIPEVAAFGANKGCEWVGMVMNYYKNRHFVKKDGTFDQIVLPKVTKAVLQKKGISFRDISSPREMGENRNELYILPFDYFSPKSHVTRLISKTNNTYSIHQFFGSWIPYEQRLEQKIWLLLGLKPHRFMWHFDKLLARLFNINR